MATSVKMDEDTKSRLEALQAEIKLETGKKVTQQELLRQLVDSAHDSKQEFVDSFRERTVPLDDDEVDVFFGWSFDSGAATEEEDIDRILYDEEHA